MFTGICEDVKGVRNSFSTVVSCLNGINDNYENKNIQSTSFGFGYRVDLLWTI
ncbi:hypothetical protein GCM10011356_05120 [Kangiella profundi]|nr:hypothetical protein GCM10011356_05120 [Kangiella profundi]